MSNALDYVTAAILMDTAVERGGQDHELIIDTIQFTNQCARMGDDCEGNVEIWDVRSLRYANLTSLRQVSMVREVRTRKARLTDDVRPSERERIQALRAVSRGRASFASPPIFRWLNGSVCTLSPSWYQCVACAGSKTEDACRFARSDGRPGWDPSQRYQFIPNATGMWVVLLAVEDKGFRCSCPAVRGRRAGYPHPPMGMGQLGPWIGAARHAAQRRPFMYIFDDDQVACDSGIPKDCNWNMFAVRNQEAAACAGTVTGKGGGQGNPRPVDAMDWHIRPLAWLTGAGARLGAPTAGPRALAWAETGDMR